MNAYSDGQFFFRITGESQFENPSVKTLTWELVFWCGDVEFTDFENGNKPIGFTGKCLSAWMSNPSKLQDAGAQLTTPSADAFVQDNLISSVFVMHMNAFAITRHKNTDNFVSQFWDDGCPKMSYIGWNVHDEGDLRPNSATGSWSGAGRVEWISAETAAGLANVDVAWLIPSNFVDVYE